MKTVRKLTTAMLAMVLAMLLLLTACGGGGSSSSGSNKPSSSSGKPSSSSSASGTQTSTKVTVTVKSANSSYGTVTGGGSYTKGSSVTVKATPASGYAFTGWQKNGSTVSTSASYTFTASESVTLTANFSKVDLSTYKLYKLAEKAQNGYTMQYEIYEDDDPEAVQTGYITSSGNKTYAKSTLLGDTSVKFNDGTYLYELDEASKIYEKTGVSSGKKIGSYTLPKTSDIEAVTVGKTTVNGAEYYSETIELTVNGVTEYKAYCFDGSGNLKYCVYKHTYGGTSFGDLGIDLFDVTLKCTGLTFTADASKLTLEGYTNIDDLVEVDVSANADSYGTVTGEGVYPKGTKVTVTATPTSGFVFTGWKESGSIVSTSTSYTFTASESHALTAVFEFGDNKMGAINSTNFPDETFRNYVSTNFDTNGDGKLSASECTAVTKIGCEYSWEDGKLSGVTDLTGIEYFVNLQELYCSGNQLTSLDVSKNTKLETLDCYGTQLTSLDVSKNARLKTLNCSSNQLTKLDLSKNTNLSTLYCSSNKLTNLDISKNKNLSTLNCSSNLLTSLDFSNNAKLEYLSCEKNQLTNLNVSGATALKSLNCYGNQLTSLDVSKNTALYGLECGMPLGGEEKGNLLTSLDVSKNTELEYLLCDYNQLTSLDVSKNAKLKTLQCNYNNLTSLNISGATTLETLWCEHNQLTNLDVSTNTKLYYLYCRYNNLVTLDVSDNETLSKYTGNSNADSSVTFIRTKAINATASPSDYGTVTGGGNYTKGTSVTVTATPNTGYQFKEWKLNGVTASGSASYTFTVSSSCELTAVFISEVEENAKLKQFNYSSVAYNGTDYSKYYVLKNFSPSACYKMGNYSALAAHGCTAIADAAAYTAQTGVVVDPTASWNTTVGCTWKWCSVEQTTTTVAQQLSQIYVNLMNGKATIVRFKSAGNEGYSVAAVGIRKGADKSNLTAADFLMIDPSRGKVMAGNQITDNGVLAYMYDRPDGKDYRLRVTP